MMLKILQIATVAIFAGMIILGVIIVIATPDKIGAYGQLVGFILPAWITSITAALLGRPITDAAAGLKAKLSETTTTTTTVGEVTEIKTQSPPAPPQVITDPPAGGGS